MQEEFVSQFNQRCAKAPKNDFDLHSSITGFDFNSIFCIQEQRILNNDSTVVYQTHLLQLLKKQPIRLSAGVVISVHKDFDGTISLFCKGHRLNYNFIEPSQRPKQKKKPENKLVKNTYFKPPENHPWRKG